MNRSQIRYDLMVEVKKIESIDDVNMLHAHLRTNRREGAKGKIKGTLSICGQDACYVEHDSVTSVYLLTEIEPICSS